MARLSIDPDVCTGHGRCFDLAPQLFEPDAAGLGTVVVGDVPADLIDAAHRAVMSCPERAITLTETP
jgi:ferredoxin